MGPTLDGKRADHRHREALYIGCAGWSLPPELRTRPVGRSVLARYAELFNAVEINSTHYDHHRSKTFEKWAADAPEHFRFAVKMQRNIKHVQRLTNVAEAMRFLDPLTAFGEKLGAVLVQLPPSLVFSLEAEEFLRELVSVHKGPLAIEPRHISWAQGSVEQLLKHLGIARVAADPPLITDHVLAAGDRTRSYYRFHGNPQMYRSVYTDERLAQLADLIDAERVEVGTTYVFFDNTLSGAAHANATHLRTLLGGVPL